MSINSKVKGKVGEREVAHLLREAGYKDARRSQQYCGTDDTSDVVCDSLPYPHHIEVKRDQKLNVEKALQQAERDRGEHTSTPVVFHRKNGEAWKVTLRADDYLKLMMSLSILMAPSCLDTDDIDCPQP